MMELMQWPVDMFVSAWQVIFSVDGYSALVGLVVLVVSGVALTGLIRAKCRDRNAQREADKAAQKRVYDDAQAVVIEADNAYGLSDNEQNALLDWVADHDLADDIILAQGERVSEEKEA